MLSRGSLCLLLTLIGGAQAATAVRSREVRLPLEFEANQGQFATQVLFLARTPSHFVYLTRDGMTLGLSSSAQRGAALRMRLVDANRSVTVAPENRLAGISNYFIGNDRSRWHRGVPHYGRIRYGEVWLGIDLVFHGRDQSLEYDFTVAPGADPSTIRLSYANAGKLSIEENGDLTIETASGKVTERLPEIYQESSNGTRRAVRGKFRITQNQEVRFEVGAYDHRRPLVIDPAIVYSTYIGGTGTIAVKKIAVDNAGDLYLTGSVSSPNFPVVNPAQQFSTDVGLFRSADKGSTWGAANPAFGTSKVLSIAADPSNAPVAYAGTSVGVFKTTNSGSTWASASVGLPNDSAGAVAVDPLSASTLYACTPEGLFKSTDGATSWKLLPNAGAPVTVAVDPKTEGSLWLSYSFGVPLVSFDGGKTYFQANSNQFTGTSIAIDPANSKNVFFGAANQGLLVTNDGGISFHTIMTGLVPTAGSSVTVNAIAIDPKNSANMLVGTNTGIYMSISGGLGFNASAGLGGRAVLSLLYDPKSSNIAVAGTAAGGVYVSTDGGRTWKASGPSNLDVNGLAMSADEQSTWAGLYAGNNAFVTKINPAGTSIVFSTYLGGSGQTNGSGIAVDSSGRAFVCGSTGASDFPIVNQHQSYAGGVDMFVSRLSASGSLDVSTFLGGRADDECYGVALDASDNLYLTGTSILLNGGSSDFPTTPGVFGPHSLGGQDCVVAKFDSGLAKLIYSTFLGGGSADSCYEIAVDISGSAYVAGTTFSTDFLTTQTPFGGSQVVGSSTNSPSFVSEIKPDGSALVYSGLLGGLKGTTQLNSIAVNSAGRAYVTGFTEASDYPITSDAMKEPAPSSNYSAMLTIIEAGGTKLVYSTILPGDYAQSLVVDGSNNVWLTGSTVNSTLAVTPDALPHTMAEGAAVTPWVMEVDPTTSTVLHASYVSGSAGGEPGDIAMGPDGSIYVAGTTLSTDFAMTGSPFTNTQSSGYAAFIMRLDFSSGGGSGNGPSIAAVANGASFQNGFASGSWMTIVGTKLSSVTDTWNKAIVNNHFPTVLDGVSVNVNGNPAYVYFVSAGQINVVAPDVPPGPVTVTVTNSLGTSDSFAATAETEQPAFFLWNNTYAVATRQDFSLAVKPGTFAGKTTVAAKPGDVIILWGTGFGPTNPPATAGIPVPASSFPTANPVTVKIGTTSAKVYGTALAPGFAALYQVGIQIPTSLSDGDYPVVATVNGQSSPATALITVHH